MTLTIQQIATFYRCSEFYRLTAEGVPHPPTTAQVVSRSVRDAIQDDLAHKIATGALRCTPDACKRLEHHTYAHMSRGVALTDLEASGGRMRVLQKVMLSAQRMFLMWRSVAGCRMDVTEISRSCTLKVGDHSITGIVEIVDDGVRATKVRSKRPEEGEASRDITLAIQALAIEAQTATVDYLIDTKEIAYVRQEVDFDYAMLAAAEQRVKTALDAIARGSFVPAPADAWYCRTCSLRMICQYV